MSHAQIPSRIALLLVLLFIICPGQQAQTPSPALADLQRDFTMRYLEPEPHLALAKYYVDRGDRLVAFYISEAARRRFEEKIFDPAFFRVFDGFDNSKAAEARLLAEYSHHPDSLETIDALADIYISRDDWLNAKRYLRAAIQKKPEDFRFTLALATVLDREDKRQEAAELTNDYVKKFPNSAAAFSIRAEKLTETQPHEARRILEEGLKLFPTDGHLLFDLGITYQREDRQKAEEALVKAAELAPKSQLIQMWVGRFFFKIKTDNSRALEYYLNAYFLNPHAYETEFVESRIRKIAFELASERVAEQAGAGVSLVSLLSDPNPVVVSLALEQTGKNWLPAYLAPVVQLLGHPDPGLRGEAAETLKTKVDSSFDVQLKALLQDDDLAKRGLAIYIAVYRWKAKSFGLVRNLLKDESELIRFDAVSALLLEGGPAGRKLAIAHAAHEPNATLKKLIETEAKGSLKNKREAP